MLYILIYVIYILSHNAYSATTTCEGEDDGPVVAVYAVRGSTAHLPCNITTEGDPDHDIDNPQKVVLVVWYRNCSKTSIYSIDSRFGSVQNGKHWTTPSLGNRASYSVSSYTPPTIMLENVTEADAGMYRCRVDFRTRPAQNTRMMLSVLDPPINVTVHTKTGVEVQDAVTYQHGRPLELSCTAYGGKPSSTLLWFLDDVLIDNTTEHIYLEGGESKVKGASPTPLPNAINYIDKHYIFDAAKITRGSKLRCVAVNNPHVHASASITLHRLNDSVPLHTTITTSSDSVNADQKMSYTCQTTGVFPPATITWYIRDQLIIDNQVHTSNYSTSTSKLITRFRAVDNGAKLNCTAHAPSLPHVTSSAIFKLSIIFVPKVRLKLLRLNKNSLTKIGKTKLNASVPGFKNFTVGRVRQTYVVDEGMNLALVCHAEANPKFYRATFLLNGRPLPPNQSNRRMRQLGRRLELQGVTLADRGMWTCLASNSVGDGQSNAVSIQVNYSPTCKLGFAPITVYTTEGSLLSLKCSMDSSPPIVFSWRIHTPTNNNMIIKEQLLHQNSGLKSHAFLKVTRDSALDQLICTASNNIGDSIHPCRYIISITDRPSELTNCEIKEVTSSSANISCDPLIGNFTDLGLNYNIKVRKIEKQTPELNGPMSQFLSPGRIKYFTLPTMVPDYIPPGSKLLVPSQLNNNIMKNNEQVVHSVFNYILKFDNTTTFISDKTLLNMIRRFKQIQNPQNYYKQYDTTEINDIDSSKRILKSKFNLKEIGKTNDTNKFHIKELLNEVTQYMLKIINSSSETEHLVNITNIIFKINKEKVIKYESNQYRKFFKQNVPFGPIEELSNAEPVFFLTNLKPDTFYSAEIWSNHKAARGPSIFKHIITPMPKAEKVLPKQTNRKSGEGLPLSTSNHNDSPYNQTVRDKSQTLSVEKPELNGSFKAGTIKTTISLILGTSVGVIVSVIAMIALVIRCRYYSHPVRLQQYHSNENPCGPQTNLTLDPMPETDNVRSTTPSLYQSQNMHSADTLTSTIPDFVLSREGSGLDERRDVDSPDVIFSPSYRASTLPHQSSSYLKSFNNVNDLQLQRNPEGKEFVNYSMLNLPHTSPNSPQILCQNPVIFNMPSTSGQYYTNVPIQVLNHSQIPRNTLRLQEPTDHPRRFSSFSCPRPQGLDVTLKRSHSDLPRQQRVSFQCLPTEQNKAPESDALSSSGSSRPFSDDFSHHYQNMPSFPSDNNFKISANMKLPRTILKKPKTQGSSVSTLNSYDFQLTPQSHASIHSLNKHQYKIRFNEGDALHLNVQSENIPTYQEYNFDYTNNPQDKNHPISRSRTFSDPTRHRSGVLRDSRINLNSDVQKSNSFSEFQFNKEVLLKFPHECVAIKDK